VAQVGEREGSNSIAQSASKMNDFSFIDVNWEKGFTVVDFEPSGIREGLKN
jgi:hypothetical protein